MDIWMLYIGARDNVMDAIGGSDLTTATMVAETYGPCGCCCWWMDGLMVLRLTADGGEMYA